MNKILSITLVSIVGIFSLSSSIYAEGFIKKEVYSFKDKNGNTVFTDKQPTKTKAFKTQTIEAANSTGDSQYNTNTQNEQFVQHNNQMNYEQNTSSKEQVVRVIVEDSKSFDKKSYKKKGILKRCKSFKKKFDYYSEKMNSGYKSSEYKKLEKNRNKFKNLLFKNCDTRTFAD